MTSCGMSKHLPDHSWIKLYVNIQVYGACVYYVVVSKFNGSHFGLPPSSIHRLTGLGGKMVWTVRYSHRPHCSRRPLNRLWGVMPNWSFVDMQSNAYIFEGYTYTTWKKKSQNNPPEISLHLHFARLKVYCMCATHQTTDRFQVVGGNRVFGCPPMPTSNWLCMCCHGRQPYLKGVHRHMEEFPTLFSCIPNFRWIIYVKMCALSCVHMPPHFRRGTVLIICFSCTNKEKLIEVLFGQCWGLCPASVKLLTHLGLYYICLFRRARSTSHCRLSCWFVDIISAIWVFSF